ncbi:5'-3' exonuclease PLD3-like isoform X2 [Culicoides brevitarsis]|uniref:5'-3' exonuclease PLD3-like isoform X2 n=1 Tax=Culicoides brevitarsis TaxID=469753 RepID=UPI00307BA598
MKYTLTVDQPKTGDDISTSSAFFAESPSPRQLTAYDIWDREQKQMRGHNASNDDRYENQPFCRPSCIPISLILILIVLVVLLPLLDGSHEKMLGHGKRHKGHFQPALCNSCRITPVESIPEGLVYPNDSLRFMSTFEAWEALIKAAEEKIEIGSFYWTLRREDVANHSSAWEGEKIFESLLEAGTKRGIQIKIAQSKPSDVSPNTDTEILASQKAAVVRSVDFPRLVGGGVLHTKLWIVDRQHFYVGSANMDWRSLTQVKELGILATNCTCLADDIAKIFEVYWKLGQSGAKIPKKWPAELQTEINATNQAQINFVDLGSSNVYLSSSPPQMSPMGREQDIDAIVKTILDAEKFVYVSVMDYIPMMLYTKELKFWPVIDDALRKVAIEKNVTVRLLISHWKHSRSDIDYFLHSLQALNEALPGVNIEVRRFVVPATPDQEKIPFGRVNHNKYMVTDKTAYIGTSNWSGDYFTNTAGIGFVIADDPSGNRRETMRHLIEGIFNRDWNSPYAVKF